MQVSELISARLFRCYTVESYVTQHEGNLDSFDDFAFALVDDAYIRNLILAPDGVVEKVYPYEENKDVIGLDYYSDSSEGNREAVIAAQSRQLLLAGPFTTVVGDQAISGRLPVYLKNADGEEEFWGLISITLRYPEIIEGADLEALEEQGYGYELWRVNADTGEHQVIMQGGPPIKENAYVERPVNIANAEWYFRMGPVKQWYQYSEAWILIIVGATLAWFAAALVRKNQQLTTVKEELEMMVHRDSLTGLLNRQGLFFELERLAHRERSFLVYFMDLNRFKAINDTYGHKTGDMVLIEFSRRLDKHTDGSHILARISGDEFILVHVDETLSEERMDVFWKAVNKEFEKPVLSADGKEILVKFSKGMACYPTDAQTLDDVISCADIRMYEEKNHANPQ